MFDLEEIAEKSNTEAKTISYWLNEGLLSPELTTTDSTPFFSDKSLKYIENIKSLFNFGYNLEEVKKIVKKVGLPEQDLKKQKQIQDKSNYLTIGTLAEKVEVSTRTIKHWEEKGIIEPDLRSRGGFRLFKDHYIFFCNLIKDLQLFGYSLEQIKTISDYFRDFINLRDDLESVNANTADKKLELMEEEIQTLYNKTEQLKYGIKRWDDLLKKQKKQITTIKERNKKRLKKDGKNG